MKKILTILGVTLMSFTYAQTTNTQTTESNNEFSKWQIRLRAVAVVPNEGDNLDNAKVMVKKNIIPELDITYFFTKNFAAELVLGTSNHDVYLRDFVPGKKVSLGNVWLLPPTLSLQYHFYSYDKKVKPYLGAGINYTLFYGIDSGDVQDITYDSNLGFSFQTGIDYYFSKNWFLNADLKYILLNTDVEVNVDGTTVVPAKVVLDPFLAGIGVGYRF